MNINDFKRQVSSWRENLCYQEFIQVKNYIKNNNEADAYYNAIEDRYIIQTLVDKKMRAKLKDIKTIILVGCGCYPYSLYDVHKQYPHIKLIGIEIDKNKAFLAKKLSEKTPAKESIEIVHTDGLQFNYSDLTTDDFIFLSVDVEKYKEIFNKILTTSRATPFLCAPYHRGWYSTYLGS